VTRVAIHEVDLNITSAGVTASTTRVGANSPVVSPGTNFTVHRTRTVVAINKFLGCSASLAAPTGGNHDTSSGVGACTASSVARHILEVVSDVPYAFVAVDGAIVNVAWLGFKRVCANCTTIGGTDENASATLEAGVATGCRASAPGIPIPNVFAVNRAVERVAQFFKFEGTTDLATV